MGKYTDKVSRGNGPKMKEFMKNTSRCYEGGKDTGGGCVPQKGGNTTSGKKYGQQKPDADG